MREVQAGKSGRHSPSPAPDRRTSLLPQDPLVRWLIWLAVAISIGVPVLAALVLMIVE